ncbi:MAG: DNA repair protein RecO [Bacteroidales bacterium]|jgi:DNA repair protein RecO (recombination protein O)|nr:DNA repair protein RecO [Bacteroidales bacterium]
MIYSTKGIVLKNINYSESSTIVRIFTSRFGLRSYIIKGGRKPKSKLHSNIFQPLFLLDLQVYNNPKKDIQMISDANISTSLSSTFSDIRKISLAFFLSEILNHCIKEEQENIELYNFLERKILSLNSLEKNFYLFHIFFLLELSEYLGFFPMNNFSIVENLFDITKGHYVREYPLHKNCLSKEDSQLFNKFLSYKKQGGKIEESINISKEESNKLLDILILFYETHLIGLNSIKSHKVLSTILH